LIYLEQWMESREELEKAAAREGGDRPPKPSNGWKLDKNIQNWLLFNLFDDAAVDEDVFAIMLMYVRGLRGGPLERLRESAREANFGKGTKAERARNVLRALAGVGEEEGA
jgi:Rab3 GTPase-activating protein catalytic subunit